MKLMFSLICRLLYLCLTQEHEKLQLFLIKREDDTDHAQEQTEEWVSDHFTRLCD